MLDFLASIPLRLTGARNALVAAAVEAERFDIDAVIQRYCWDLEVDDALARRRWRELVRYLLMAGKANKRGYGMCGPVDALWHEFVLHTQLYQAFCSAHAGRFIHHHPGSTEKGAAWRSAYLRFLVDYRLIFGEAPPDDIWPIPPVPGVKLPATTAELSLRHVAAVARTEAGGRRDVSGCGAVGCSTGGDGGGCGGGGDGGGCGGGGDG